MFKSNNIVFVFLLSYFFAFLFFYSTPTYAGWIKQTNAPIQRLYDVFFVDVNTGYAVGYDPTYPWRSIILKTTNGGTNWIKINKKGQGYDFESVFFLDANTGYVGGGTFLKTTDGGTTWFSPYSPIGTTFFFLDTNTGYTIGGYIFKTTNGGVSWDTVYTTLTGTYDLFFLDPNTGYVVGSTGRILKTTDGGNSWIKQSFGAGNDLYSVFFLDGNTGYAVGFFGVTIKTTNGGTNWNTIGFSAMESIFFLDTNTGYAVDGWNDGIVKTTDGGTTWFLDKPITHPYGGYWSIFFVDTNTGYTVGDSGAIWKYTGTAPIPNAPTNLKVMGYTSNGVFLQWQDNADNETGYTVYRFNNPIANLPPNTTTYLDTALVSGNYSYKVRAVNDSGVSAFTGWANAEVVTGVENKETENNKVKGFSLLQNYPNPFNPETSIGYQVMSSEHISLRIYNTNGQLIKTLVNEKKESGFYTVNWNGKDESDNGVPSGIYFYTLQVGDKYKTTRKMVLLK